MRQSNADNVSDATNFRKMSRISSNLLHARRQVRLMRGDVSLWKADCLVVSANPYCEGIARSSYWRFNGRKNADGAVHREAGASLVAHAHRLMSSHGPLQPGQAAVTRAVGALQAKWVIHCVAPEANAQGAQDDLRRTFEAAIAAAVAVDARSLALPAIGCGVKGFQPEQAGDVAFSVISKWLNGKSVSDAMHARVVLAQEILHAREHSESLLSRLDIVVFSDDVARRWWSRAPAWLGVPAACAGQRGYFEAQQHCCRDGVDCQSQSGHGDTSDDLSPGDLVWYQATQH